MQNEYSDFKSRWRQDFPRHFRPALRHTQTSVQLVPGLFAGGEAAAVWRWPPTQSSAEFKRKSRAYIYSPCETARLM
jgi:hypothetical protein